MIHSEIKRECPIHLALYKAFSFFNQQMFDTTKIYLKR